MSFSVFSAAREAPDRLALVTDGLALSYAALAEQARAALGYLEAAGAVGKRVALVAEPSVDAVVAFHALVASGTPVALLHPRWTDVERARATQTLEPLFRIPTDASWKDRTRGAQSEAPPDDARPLAILHTSGSSGGPKAVELSRAAFAASADASAENLGWREDDRWLLSLPFAHVGGLSVLTRCLQARRTVVLDTGDVPQSVARHRVTLLSLVPAQVSRLLAAGWNPPPHVRAILVGGAAASSALLASATARGWPVLATYGMTEACSQVATQAPGAPAGGSVGRPLARMEVRVVEGVIELRGPALFTCYLPSGDARRTPDGWFETGDLGRLEGDGTLQVLGRRDDVIITGGEKVFPQEVEEALARVPGIEDACVFGEPDPTWGQRVCAALVAHGGAVDDRRLTTELAVQLAPFKWPRQIAGVASIPRGSNGKVDRKALAAQCRPALRPLRSA